MTKVKDMARITPLKTKAAKIPMTSTTIRGNANNAGFKRWLDLRHSQQLSLQDIIQVALEELQQPVSTQEMQHYLKREARMDLKDYRVKYALDQLVSAGKAAVHLETDKERALRANGVPVTPKPAYLFNSGAKARTRTVAVVVDGYTIFDPRSLAGKPKPRKKTLASQPAVITSSTGIPVTIAYTTKTGAASTTNVGHSAVDYLIEKLVAERTADLRRQLDEANAKLDALRKLVG